MTKFNIASLKSKISTAALKAHFNSVRKNRTRLLQLTAIVILVVLALWFFNNLLDGALFTLLLAIVFVVGFCSLIFACAPEETVKFVEQVIEGSKAHWARLKRSIKKLRELMTNKSPVVVVDDEAEKVASAPSPVSPVPAPAAPAAPSTTKTKKRTSREPASTSAPAAPASAPAPVKSSATVVGGPDALGKVAAATGRVRRAGRVLSMDEGDKA